jgi:3-oxoacyl-[acyl-carrier-protein] synthase II
MSATRVVVTGLGTTSPVGGDVPSTWAALLAGQSGVGPIKHEWAEQLGTQIAAEVAVDPKDVLDRVKARRLDRSGQLALVAALEAWADSGLGGEDSSSVDPERLGVAMASGIGGVQTLLANYDLLNEKGPRRVSPLAIPMLMPNSPAANIGLAIGAKAGVHTPVSACASGNEAIALGIDMIRLGRADVVVVGGTEAAVHPLPMAAFGQMMALSKRNDDPAAASRPWDKGRDGFVLGEGAAALVLESAEHAEARGARVYAEAAGAGITADSHDIAQPDPSGLGATRAMKLALREAGMEPSDIHHINAHATSTPQGDLAESGAIRNALGDAASGVIVTSTKSMTGHLLGAAGALEAVITIQSIYHRLVPATINLEDQDPEIPLNVVTGEHQKLPDGDIAALNNSFGFGGHNVALAIRSI